MRIIFDKDPLAVEQNNSLIEIVNVYIVYVSDAKPKFLLRNVTLKNCLLREINIVRNMINNKINICI